MKVVAASGGEASRGRLSARGEFMVGGRPWFVVGTTSQPIGKAEAGLPGRVHRSPGADDFLTLVVPNTRPMKRRAVDRNGSKGPAPGRRRSRAPPKGELIPRRDGPRPEGERAIPWACPRVHHLLPDPTVPSRVPNAASSTCSPDLPESAKRKRPKLAELAACVAGDPTGKADQSSRARAQAVEWVGDVARGNKHGRIWQFA